MKKRTEKSVLRFWPFVLSAALAVILTCALFSGQSAALFPLIPDTGSGAAGSDSPSALSEETLSSEDPSSQDEICPPEITKPGISEELLANPPIETIVDTGGDTESIYQYSSYYTQVEEGHNNALIIEAQIVRLVNDEREKQGLTPLIFDSDLANSAAIRARELSESFSHIRPDGGEYFTSFPPSYALMGENLAEANGIISDPDFASACITYWMDLQSHRDNILNPEFTLTGVGVHIINGHMYAVQLFGTPEKLY